MIRCLHIANLAIIREATVELGPGLNLLTGETGAGKSIIVDALMLVLGGRSDPETIRSGEERAAVEAILEISGRPDALAFLEARGYTAEDGTIVARREIAAGGRGRASLGGALCPASDLRSLGALLVDVHGQNQQQSLLIAGSHRDLLDRHAGLMERRDAMAEAARALASAEARLAGLRDGAQRIAQRLDMLRFQVGEIDRAAVRPGERAALRAERDLLRNSETVLRAARAAYEALYEGDGSALERLAAGLRAARELLRFDAGLREEIDRGEAARADLQELARTLRDYPDRLQFDPGRLEAIDERLAALESLLRKYAPPGGDEEALLAHRARSAEELSQLTGGGETVADLETRVEGLRQEALRIAADLSERRRRAAAGLERRVEEELAILAMAGTRFAVDFRTRPLPGSGLWVEGEEVAVDAAGYDVVEFLLSANRGEALRPLSSVASGGELSRLMLALEVVLRREAEARTLVFDEIDAGIGGAVAEAVGRRLHALAQRHQVICVTHLPQIASWADRHIQVSKRAARGRTEVALEALDGAGRVRELARMLAGERVTPAALRHAAELLGRGAPR